MRNGPLDDSHDGDESTTTASTPPPKRLHAQIGRYRVDGVLGRSSGVVYRATQQNPHRPVALKVLRPDSRSPEALARLMQEAEILARLSHPHIAQVYESGTHDDGHGEAPYVAMEYVPNAKSLTKYANERSLNTAARLKLFQQVCEAVSHGHFKGVLHCDLKPSNILVNPDGQVKVIDFGISQWMGASPGDPGGGSDYGQMLGTIPYMSPEQTEPDRSELDLRTDVYSLGVVLFELISGGLPFDTTDKPRSEILRMIREDAPARLRDEKPDEPRDLEAIVERAMRKDRGERYQSVDELQADIEHFLLDEPLPSQPQTIWNSLVKLLRAQPQRHPVGSVLTASTVVLLAALYFMTPLFHKTLRLHQPMGRWLAATFPADATAAGFRHVRVLRITEDTTYPWAMEYASANGLGDFVVPPAANLRGVYGDLMKRLAKVQPAALVFDIRFLNPSEHDVAFLAGVDALREKNIDVVVVVYEWHVTGGGFNEVNPNYRQKVRWGCAKAGFDDYKPWHIELFVGRHGYDNVPALGLVAIAAARQPGYQLRIDPERATNMLLPISFFRFDERDPRIKLPAPAGSDVLLPFGYLGHLEGTSENGLEPGDIICQHSFEVPDDEVLAASTLNLEWVMTAPLSEVQAELRDMIIVVGNFAAADYSHTVDGRRLHGSIGHASAIESLLRQDNVWYLSMTLAAILAVIAGLLFGHIPMRLRRARLAVYGVAAALSIAVPIIAFIMSRAVVTPFVPCASFLVTWEVVRRLRARV